MGLVAEPWVTLAMQSLATAVIRMASVDLVQKTAQKGGEFYMQCHLAMSSGLTWVYVLVNRSLGSAVQHLSLYGVLVKESSSSN